MKLRGQDEQRADVQRTKSDHPRPGGHTEAASGSTAQQWGTREAQSPSVPHARVLGAVKADRLPRWPDPLWHRDVPPELKTEPEALDNQPGGRKKVAEYLKTTVP